MKSDIASDDDFIDDFIERVRVSLCSCTGCAFDGASPEAQAVLHEAGMSRAEGAFDAASSQSAPISLGAAVSGGADSVLSLIHI